jgi:hypothetical protein
MIEPIESVGMRGANRQAHAEHASMLAMRHPNFVKIEALKAEIKRLSDEVANMEAFID